MPHRKPIGCTRPARRLSRRLATAWMCLAASAAANAQARYHVTELPILAGMAQCVATHVNDLGDVVGYCAPPTENFNQTAVLWRGGQVVDIGKLSKGQYSIANSINQVGQIAGVGDTGNYRPQAFFSRGSGSLVNIFPNNGGNTHALFMAHQGWIGGYYTKKLGGSGWTGAIWTVDPKDPRRYRTTDLPTLPGGSDPSKAESVPMGFNHVGQAVGYAMNDQIGQRAVLWNNDPAHAVALLPMPAGDGSSIAYAVNDLGQAVGSSHPAFGSRAIFWNNDVARSAQVLPSLPGDNYGRAHAINNLGQALGVSYYGTPGSWEATPERLVVWRDGSVVELQAALDPTTGAGLSLVGTANINNTGQIGATALRGGRKRALLLSPQN